MNIRGFGAEFPVSSLSLLRMFLLFLDAALKGGGVFLKAEWEQKAFSEKKKEKSHWMGSRSLVAGAKFLLSLLYFSPSFYEYLVL